MIYSIVAVVTCILCLIRGVYTEKFFDGSCFDFYDIEDRALLIFLTAIAGVAWPLSIVYFALDIILSKAGQAIHELKKSQSNKGE